MIGTAFFSVWRYVFNKNDAAPVKRIYEYDREFTWEMSRQVSRPVRALSREENAATTNHYP